MEPDNSLKKETTSWTYTPAVKPLIQVVHSPFMNSPKEEKEAFCRVLDNYIEKPKKLRK